MFSVVRRQRWLFRLDQMVTLNGFIGVAGVLKVSRANVGFASTLKTIGGATLIFYICERKYFPKKLI